MLTLASQGEMCKEFEHRNSFTLILLSIACSFDSQKSCDLQWPSISHYNKGGKYVYFDLLGWEGIV